MPDSSSYPALITAIGGVTVSLMAIWAQGRKVDKTDVRCQAALEAVTNQMADLAAELSLLRTENHDLRIKIAVLEARQGQ